MISPFLKHKQITLKQTDGIIDTVLTQQKSQNFNFKYPDDRLNILKMMSANYMSFKTQDLIFSVSLSLFNDKKVWKKIRKDKINFEQMMGVNSKHLMFLAYFISKYNKEELKYMNTNSRYLDIVLLSNLKMNFTDDSSEFFDNVIIPYINILIFELDSNTEEIKKYFETLNTYLNDKISSSNQSDYIFILYTILENLKAKKIVNIEF